MRWGLPSTTSCAAWTWETSSGWRGTCSGPGPGGARAAPRYRPRSVDLVANPAVPELFRRRSRIVAALRAFLDARGFLEVETPMMQTIAGGGDARLLRRPQNAPR